MSYKLKDEQIDQLFEAVLQLQNIDECYAFFTDLCTISEIKSMAQRFHVATLLNNGAKYLDICETTGVSTATISRVNRALEYGAEGYHTVFKRLAEKTKKES